MLVKSLDSFDLPVDHVVRKESPVSFEAGIAVKFDVSIVEMFVSDFDFFLSSISKVPFCGQQFVLAQQHLCISQQVFRSVGGN